MVIARVGVPVAEQVPLEPARLERRGGQWRGKARIGADFDAPMPESEELLSGWGFSSAFAAALWQVASGATCMRGPIPPGYG